MFLQIYARGNLLHTFHALPLPTGVAPAPIAEDGSEKENGRAVGPVVPKRERRVLPGAAACAGRPPLAVKREGSFFRFAPPR